MYGDWQWDIIEGGAVIGGVASGSIAIQDGVLWPATVGGALIVMTASHHLRRREIAKLTSGQ